MKKFLSLAFILTGFWFQNGVAQPLEKALLWKITHKDAKQASYLFGTYHILGDSYLSSRPEVAKALKETKGMVVELVIDSSKLAGITSYVLLKDQTLSQLLSPAEFKKADSLLKVWTPYSLAMFESIKPAAISTELAMSIIKKTCASYFDKYPGKSLDLALAEQAKKAGKKVTPLETLEEQMELLMNSESPQEQTKAFVRMINKADSLVKNGCALTESYLQGDLQSLFKMSQSDPKDKKSMELLLDARNKRWIKVLPGLIRTEPQFIAVGALHLPGELGIINLLRKEGFKVEPVFQTQ